MLSEVLKITSWDSSLGTSGRCCVVEAVYILSSIYINIYKIFELPSCNMVILTSLHRKSYDDTCEFGISGVQDISSTLYQSDRKSVV